MLSEVNRCGLADSADFNLVGKALGQDVRDAIGTALAAGAVFQKGTDPISVFRATLSESIRDIESHPRDRPFQEFLAKGPYFDSGPIPHRLRKNHLSDDEVARVIVFIYSFMVNSFKGAVAELLASGAVTRFVNRLKREGRLPSDTYVLVGDSVFVHGTKGTGWRKGADLHVVAEGTGHGDREIRVVGVAEVKSYFRSERRLREQIDQHIRRAQRGLLVSGNEWPAIRIGLGCGPSGAVIRISVEPDDWLLPRSFRFRKYGDGRRLYIDPAVPKHDWDEERQVGTYDWRIILKWSKEAITEAAVTGRNKITQGSAVQNHPPVNKLS